MLNNQFSINRIGGGNFEESELAKPRNVLIKGRLSLFAGAMIAALFVCSIVGCTPYNDPDTSQSNGPKHAISASDSTKNEGGNGSFTGDTEYADTLDYEF